jgi:methanogenic corrinoid protein MtbC1
MTEFVHKPYDKIYVRDIIKLDLDELMGMMSSLDSANAYWVDGVLFASFAMTESEELAKKEMQNEMYLDKIIFAIYEKYSKTVKSSTNLEIGVLNMQKSKLYKDLIKWLKLQSIWND